LLKASWAIDDVRELRWLCHVLIAFWLGNERPVLREALTVKTMPRRHRPQECLDGSMCPRLALPAQNAGVDLRPVRKMRQNFNRHIAVQRLVVRSVDLAHSTFADLRTDFSIGPD